MSYYRQNRVRRPACVQCIGVCRCNPVDELVADVLRTEAIVELAEGDFTDAFVDLAVADMIDPYGDY